MPHIYFIGGAPRVGKSTLMRRFLEAKQIPAAATDDLRTTLRASTTPAASPALFYLDSLNADESNMARLMQTRTADIIAAADREAEAVWPAVVDFATRHLAMGSDVVIEGVALLPHLVNQVKLPYSAIFLGSQLPSQVQFIKSYAAGHPDTWLGTLKPATVEAFAHYSIATSQHVQTEATKYKQTYLEMSAGSFGQQLAAAQKILQHTP